MLEQAIRHGFHHKAWIEHDADLTSLRAHPRFQALLTRLNGNGGAETHNELHFAI